MLLNGARKRRERESERERGEREREALPGKIDYGHGLLGLPY